MSRTGNGTPSLPIHLDAVVFVGAQLLLLAYYAADSGPHRALAVLPASTLLSAIAAAAWAVLTCRDGRCSGRALPWLLVAALAAAFSADVIARSVADADGALAYPGLPDIADGIQAAVLLCAYALLTRRASRWAPGAVVDALMAIGPVLLVAIHLSVVPALRRMDDPAGVALAVAYTLVDIAGLIAAAWLLVSRRRPGAGIGLFSAALVLWFWGDLARASGAGREGAAPPGWFDLAGALAAGLVALSLRFGVAPEGAARFLPAPAARRLAVTGAVGCLGPIVLLTAYSSGVDTPPLLIGVAALVPALGAIIRAVTLTAGLEAQASRDPLTGLANRGAFLDQVALLATEEDTRVIVALLDLDDFKTINDTHGHGTGDAVLVVIARRLAERLEVRVPGALAARLGGDEFAVVLASSEEEIDDQFGEDLILDLRSLNPRRAAAARRRRARSWWSDDLEELVGVLSGIFTEPVQVGQRSFPVRGSAGVIVQEPEDAHSSAPSLLSDADVAMYEAKNADRTTPAAPAVVVLRGEERRRARMLTHLRDDLGEPDLRQFSVHYQPIVDAETSAIVSVEALLRWTHPAAGPIGPSVFVTLAEQTGAIHTLGRFVLDTALSDLHDWGIGELTLAVNVSPAQLIDAGLPDMVRALLRAHRIAPRRLTLEITESALVDDLAAAAEAVERLRALGVRIAIDDFGTGYSSLRYLRRFQPDILKVDREFVQAAVHEPRTATVVASVVDLAEDLGLKTVAEGVESDRDVEVMRALGCRLMQGFAYSEPLSAARIPDLWIGAEVFD